MQLNPKGEEREELWSLVVRGARGGNETLNDVQAVIPEGGESCPGNGPERKCREREESTTPPARQTGPLPQSAHPELLGLEYLDLPPLPT